VSSEFGNRLDPKTHLPAQHGGVDIKAPKGTEVVATGAGKVVHAGPGVGKNASAGDYVKVDHGHGNSSGYLHLSKTTVKEGDIVKRGQVIGAVGSTGKSTGNHLHYQEKRGDKPHEPTFDPANYKVPKR